MLAMLLIALPTGVLAQTPAETEARFVAERRQVTLAETLALVAKNNLDLKAARAVADQVAAKSRLATTSVLPELTLSMSYVATSAPAVIDNGGQLDLLGALTRGSLLPADAQQMILSNLATSPRSIPIQATHSAFGTLLLQQVLFSPSFFLLPAAEEAKRAAQLGAEEAREQLLLAGARVYLGLEGLEQIEAAAKDAEGIALKRENDAKARVAAGTDTEIAVLRAQSETAQARATLASLQGNRVALLAVLESLCGEAVRPVEKQPTVLSVAPSDVNAVPWENLFAIRAGRIGLQSQQRFNTVDRLAFLPSIVAQGKVNYNSNQGFVGRNFTFDGIVAAQWSIYDRGVRYVNMRENDAKTEQQRAQLESAIARGKANWIGATTNLQAAAVAMQQAESQAQLAQKAQKQLGGAFSVGLATSLEVSDIDNKAFFAASAAAQAKAQYEIRKVELAAAEGRLGAVVGLAPKE
jgi:outer membrane protein